MNRRFRAVLVMSAVVPSVSAWAGTAALAGTFAPAPEPTDTYAPAPEPTDTTPSPEPTDTFTPGPAPAEAAPGDDEVQVLPVLVPEQNVTPQTDTQTDTQREAHPRAAATPTSLPSTGAPVGVVLVVAGGSVAAGTALVLAGRRRTA